jgi:hypothetical protein
MNIMTRIMPALVATIAMLATGQIEAGHHSFAVFFNDKTIEISGAVTEFRFTNPHGLISLTVKGPSGEEAWKVETNAQTIMRRRGWTKDTLTIGETIKVEGWPSRDGAKYLRMRAVSRADGTVLFGPGPAQPAPGGAAR